MTTGDQPPVLGFTVYREAGARLRGGSGPLRARLYWPAPADTAPALVVFVPDRPDTEAFCRSLCAQAGVVVLAANYPTTPDDAMAVLEWAADHAAELDADPEQLFVAGGSVATAVMEHADEQGWPDVRRYESEKSSGSDVENRTPPPT